MSLSQAQSFLNISKNASIKDIKSAYRKLLHKMHPDAGGSLSEFEILQQAYTIALTSLNSTKSYLPQGWPKNLKYIDMQADVSKIGFPQKRFNIEIKEVSPVIGKGGFALEFIPKDMIIQEYTGERSVVHHTALTNMPYATTLGLFDRSTNTIDYTAGSGEYQAVIDAQSAGNETRFFNHSKNPNAYFIMDPMLLGHVFVLASRDINPGEEITVNYGDDYWKNKKDKPL